jgi:hypothetical protein
MNKAAWQSGLLAVVSLDMRLAAEPALRLAQPGALWQET